ncbi:MAG: hypothetical protein ACXAC7_18180, partial [Candidatus Hodarchaeales archaeon]
DHITKAFESDTAHIKKRLYLLAYFINEFSIKKEELDFDPGNEIHWILDSILDIIPTQTKTENYEIEISQEGWKLLKRVLARNNVINVVKKEELKNNKFKITFEKEYKRTQSMLRRFSTGKLFID